MIKGSLGSEVSLLITKPYEEIPDRKQNVWNMLHISSPPHFSNVRVTQPFIFCVVF
jgi:hypothetical protein